MNTTKKKQLHLFLIKTHSKSGTEEKSLNLIKSIYKYTAKIVFNSGRLNSLSLRIKWGGLLSPLQRNIVQEVLDSVRKKQKEIKGIQISKEEVKLFLLDVIVYVENQVESIFKSY